MKGKTLVGIAAVGGIVGYLLWRRRRQVSGPSGGGGFMSRVRQIRNRLTRDGVPYVPIPFAYDSAEIPAESREALNDIAAYMVARPSLVVEVIGHTDSAGSLEYNQRLSEQRADAVWTYLTDQGVDTANLYATGKGETEPVADNATAEGRALNRRVEFVVMT